MAIEKTNKRYPERRKGKRIGLTGDYFFTPDNREIRMICAVKNLSVTGACISSVHELAHGQVIYIHIRGKKDIILKAKVAWKLDTQYGLSFLLETSQDFTNISYIVNYELKNINRDGR